MLFCSVVYLYIYTFCDKDLFSHILETLVEAIECRVPTFARFLFYSIIYYETESNLFSTYMVIYLKISNTG